MWSVYPFCYTFPRLPLAMPLAGAAATIQPFPLYAIATTGILRPVEQLS